MPKIDKEPVRTLSILQNMWFKDPERMKTIYAKYLEREDEGRNRFIRDFLFFGCLTGKRIDKVFGEDFRWQTYWEEASPELGGKSGSSFGYDKDHIRNAIKVYRPKIILAFGKIASSGLYEVLKGIDYGHNYEIVYGPHPTSRSPGIIKQLEHMRNKYRKILKEQDDA